MAINFPNSPTNNQIFLDTTSGNRYIYNADKGQWRYAANSILQYASDSQVLIDRNGEINGAPGLTYNTVSNTTYANTLVVGRTASVGGDLSVSGNLFVVGSTTSLEANNLVIGDSLIYLAANNYTGTDLLAIGFVGNYGNTTGANVHTGLYRDATTKQYYLFQGYDIEPANNSMIPYSNNMVNATLNADIITGNLTLAGVNTHNWIDSAFNKANAAYANANAVSVGANTWANTVGTAGNNYTNYVALSVNTYTSILAANNAVGANNWANTIATAGNNWVTATFATLSNVAIVYNTANAAFGIANNALANTSGVTFGGNLLISGNVSVANSKIISNSYSYGLGTSSQVVDSFVKSEYRTVKYLIQGVNDTDIHSSEILLTHNDVDAYTVEYATVYSNTELYTVSAGISGNNVNLTITPNFANTIIDYYKTQLIARTITSSLSGDYMLLSGTVDLQTGSGSEDLML